MSVFFADAVGSTEQAARSSPEAFADALDALFRHFDVIADRHGLEKIKTIGDAYLAVAGAPTPVADHADAAVGMAVDILNDVGTIRWPSGDPIVVRGGIATGPAVAGVDRRPEVRVRPVGRHREPREQARGERGTRPLPGLRVDRRATGRSVRLRALRDPRGEGQGPDDRPRPPGPSLERPQHGAARHPRSNDRRTLPSQPHAHGSRRDRRLRPGRVHRLRRRPAPGSVHRRR